jgi:protein-L-isoaspartate(D-aspartate) O-methyltransferase
MPRAAEQANRALVDQMIARGALWSRPLIEAFRATPRHRFLDRIYRPHPTELWQEVDTAHLGRGELRLLYSDRALTTHLSQPAGDRTAVPISSSSQPSLMAQMLEDLCLRRGQRVLEVGAGTGYNAALLAHVVGPVVSVEVDRRVLAEAERHLAAFPDRRVELRHGDGRDGWPAAAPYDRILVTAATPDLEPAWLEQLAPGGLLLAPLDLAPGLAYLVRGGVRDGRFEGRLTRPAFFMPLREEGTPGRGTVAGLLPPPERLAAVPAPWASWLSRRPPLGGGGLLASLAFLGWLEGLAVAYQQAPEGTPAYGLADPARGNACWLGQREWRVTGRMGQEMARRLWQTFLEAGGPWPTEFQLRAWPPGVAPEAPAGRLAARRHGERCAQVWELIEPRERPG